MILQDYIIIFETVLIGMLLSKRIIGGIRVWRKKCMLCHEFIGDYNYVIEEGIYPYHFECWQAMRRPEYGK